MTYCGNTQCSEYGNCDLTFDCPLFKPTSEKPKVKRNMEKPNNLTLSEDNEQITVMQYCELKHIIAVHIPNESKRSVAYGAKMKRMGLRKGFPDIFIPTSRQGFYGLFIELKRDKKSRVSAEQTAWISYLNKQGYKAMICYGATEAINEIEKYFTE